MKNFKNKIISFLLFATLFFCSACSTQRIVISQTNMPPSFEKSYDFFFWGLMVPEDVNATRVCGGRSVAAIEVKHTIVDIVFSSITGGIYEPRTVTIYCK